MSNSFLKVTIEKNWSSQNFNQNFDFLSLKNLSPGPFLGALTHAGIIEF